MLEFTPDPVQQLTEAVRVVRAGGLLLTTRRRGLDATLLPGKTSGREMFEKTLAGLGLQNIQTEAWQVDYDLVWAVRPGVGSAGARPLEEFLLCPLCHSASLRRQGRNFVCQTCDSHYPVFEGIIDFRHHRRES
jgi:hypothetical protein